MYAKNLIFMILSLIFVVESLKHEQIHLSMGVDESEMIVTWVTMHHHPDNVDIFVHYGEHGQSRDKKIKAQQTKFVEDATKFYVHRALINHLKPDTVYDYQVGGTDDLSKVYSFRTHPKGNDWLPQFVVYGDLGLVEGKSLPYLRKDVVNTQYHAIFHIGDFAYDLHKENGKVGNDFMNSIEPISATVPYMSCPGNHERHSNFSHYDARFSMLGDRQNPDSSKPLIDRLNNHFYSLDIGPVHIIIFSSEYYYYFVEFGFYHMEKQYKWLEEDLKKANNNREKVPWIIAMAHRPMYCFKRSDSSCDLKSMERKELRRGISKSDGNLLWGLENLFFKYGVDLQFYGHEHYYTRTLPVYDHVVMDYKEKNTNKNGTHFTDPKGPIHVITGSAGNKEHHPEFNPLVNSVDWVGYHQPDYGYTKVIFKDRFKVVVEQTSDDRDGKITDDFEISKTHHTPAWMI